MLITLILLALASFGAGYAMHKNLHLRDRNPDPPQLDTPEHIINYLEACSLAQDNEEAYRLFSEFRVFANQKLLPASEDEGSIDLRKLEKKPDWYHNPQADIPQDKHWEMFLTDLRRETESSAKIDVVKHWIISCKNHFSYKEMEMMLDEFEDSKDRATVRRIYAGDKKERKRKKK